MSGSLLQALLAEGALEGLQLPEVESVQQLKGHASTRRFFRLRAAGGHAAVLVTYPGDLADEGLPRYRATTAWCQVAGVRVPAIYQQGGRALLVADGGDVLLDAVPERERLPLYRQAAEIMRRTRAAGRRWGGPNGAWALDRARFAFEFDYLERHAFGDWLQAPQDSAARAQFYGEIVDRLVQLPTVLCHRDFHARNLLVRDERLLVVDYQDLMYGPAFYDAASLLLDNYVDVPSDWVAAVLRRLQGGERRRHRLDSSLATPEWPWGLGPAERQAFVLTALQRSLKALGTFGYQVAVAGREDFARYAPRTHAHVLRCLGALGLDRYRAALAPLDDLPA